MIVLADHNLEGQALLLWGTLATGGWLELLPLQLVTLREVGLPLDSSDRAIWRFAQAQRMLLLTSNRRMKGTDSLEQTIREENIPTALPVITISNVERLDERGYRERCGSRLVEVIIDIENYLGAGRIYIP
jgi:hypothetical protein